MNGNTGCGTIHFVFGRFGGNFTAMVPLLVEVVAVSAGTCCGATAAISRALDGEPDPVDAALVRPPLSIGQVLERNPT
jgi:hypothetical protein